MWLSKCDFALCAENNGFNLVSISSQNEIERGYVIAAFDLPDEYPAQRYVGFAREQCTPDFDRVRDDEKYRFCGYDVVDLRRRSRGLYSFDWEHDDICDLINKLALTLNEYGLVTTQQDALRASHFFDDTFPSHAPFVPCGVWIAAKHAV